MVAENTEVTPNRRLSLPDLAKLRDEWDKREAIQTTLELGKGKLQIDLLNVRSDVPVKRPLMRLRMGSQHYFSSRSKHANGNWNEGFLFTISYHNQLFDTIELDLYDKRNKWRSKMRHIGKAKLKIAKLKDRESVYITFLPMYEYHVKRYLPAHIQLPHTFLKSHMPNMSRLTQYKHNITKHLIPHQEDDETDDEDDELYLDIPPTYELHPSHSRHSMTPFIGSIQVRVRYEFQHPPDDQPQQLQAPTFSHSNHSMDTFHSYLTSSRKSSSRRSSSYSSSSGTYAKSDLSHIQEDDHSRGIKASTETILNQLVLDSPTTPKPNGKFPIVTLNDEVNEEGSEDEYNYYIDLERYKSDFPKMDSENTKKNKHNHLQDISDTASIKSHNFGDKNFAFRWINESFEEVAISHPSLDRMIGMVVSPQTRILLRAVVKMFNAFGQGFKITILQLISSLSLLQNFYSEVPRPILTEKITDLKFLDQAYYFLGHAIIAYGWRGISYLGDYAKYLKDVVKTKSNKEAIVRYLKIPQEDLLGYEYGVRKGAVFQPSYFVSYDRAHSAVVLGIRGTWSIYDCITDLVCEYKPWRGGLVHSGILASAEWFFNRIIPQVFLYISEQTKSKTRTINSFIITGHSLGAGTAAVLTMMVVDCLEQLRELSGNHQFKVHCYSYAPVASVSLDISEKYRNHIDSFVCHDDLVARLSYGTASCAKELIMDSVIASDGLGGSSKVNSNPSIRQQCFDILQTRRKEIYHNTEPRYPLLYVPGQVYQFKRSNNNNSKLPQDIKLPGTKHESPEKKTATTGDVTFTLHHSSPKISEEILVSKTCLEDHMVVTYLTAFQTARQDCMRQSSFSSSASTLRTTSSKLNLKNDEQAVIIQN